MRNLLIILSFMLFSPALFGQGQPNIVVRNATSCPIYYRLYLSDVNTPCGMIHISPIIALGPGASATYNNTIVPGAYRFISARIYNGSGSCAGAGTLVGDPLCGFVNTASVNLLTAPTCTLCYASTADWVIGGVSGLQTLVIH
jgi:hypothetical protein